MQIPPVKRPTREVLAKVHSLKNYRGMIAAIEPESGEWFVGKDLMEALRNARRKYPRASFYFVRVGYPYAHSHKGGIKHL